MALPELLLHPDAMSEAAAARVWYEERNPAAASALVREVDHAVAAILDSPNRWPRYFGETPRFLLKRFPYSVVYRQLGNAVQIIAIAHARRRPGYWMHRI